MPKASRELIQPRRENKRRARFEGGLRRASDAACETPRRVRFLPVTNQTSTQQHVWRHSRGVKQGKAGALMGERELKGYGLMESDE